MDKDFKDLYTILKENDLSYNKVGQDAFKKNSQRFLKKLAEELKLKEFKVSFNPGGIAVSGDAHLMGMWSEGNGIYITINQNMGDPVFLYRKITHMKDFLGVTNHYIWGISDILNKNEMLRNLMKFKR